MPPATILPPPPACGLPRLPRDIVAGLTEPGYSGRQAAHVVGISYRQLDYWGRTDLVRPTLVDAHGSGSRRVYSRDDLLTLLLVRTLLGQGTSLERVRVLIDRLPHDWDQPDQCLAFDRYGQVMVVGDGELDAVIGQADGPVTVLSVDALARDLDQRIGRLDLAPADAYLTA